MFSANTLLLLALLAGAAQAAWAQPAAAQPAAVQLAPDLRLPADTARSRQLVGALNGWLAARHQPVAANAYLDVPLRPEDLALLDELDGLEKSTPAAPGTTYRPQLLGITDLDSSRYLLQLGWLGVGGSGQPVLRATCELLARRNAQGRFAFGSPLRLLARTWRSTRIRSCTFYYPRTLDNAAATDYARQMVLFDLQLHNPGWRTEVFCCDNLPEALRLLGVTYKADYNGYVHNSLSARASSQLLLLSADAPATRFDLHDLWHQRLRNVLPANSINKPVDEGCAFRYAGSWGLTWPQILARFQAWAATQPHPDWLQLYQNPVNFAPPGEKPLLVSYALNALLVSELERDKGFDAVQRLLGCGPQEPGNANYFRALAEVSGITQTTFNDHLIQLVREARP